MSHFGETTGAPSNRKTYVLSSGIFQPASGAGIKAQISGSGTRTVSVLKVWFSLSVYETTMYHAWSLLKQSTPCSGGTSANGNACTPLDADDGAGTSSILGFTANPSPGSLLGKVGGIITGVNGNVGSTSYGGIASGGGSMANPLILFDCDKFGKSIVLRGTSSTLALDMSQAIAAASSPPQMEVFAIVTED